jgi:hypothetical protein
MVRHFVLLETGANQAFVFASNKQAVNVGASELILRAGSEWPREAAREVTGGVQDCVVVAASGKAVLVVDSVEAGRAVIRAVTARALRDAPGLEVWGVVDEEPVGEDPRAYGPALKRVHDLHKRWRALRPSPLLRQLTLPYSQPCQYSGLPATAIGPDGPQQRPRSTPIHAAWTRARDGRDRMASWLTGEAVLSRDKLDQGITNAGWVAVVHADGNGIGEIFSTLHQVYEGEEYLARYRGFSEALDAVTRAALKEAVLQQPQRSDWILPIVIGGDDVTALIDGRVAFSVTVAFLRAFERISRDTPAITEVLARVSAELSSGGPPRDRLTAAAGIAFVKPHHPFSDAYALAEQLCASAKVIKRVDRGRSALDVHVLHDSVRRDLADLRAQHVVEGADGAPLNLWCGPIVVTGETDQTTYAGARHVDHLQAAIDALRRTVGTSPLLPVGAGHRLRDALMRGGAAINRMLSQVLAWSADDKEQRDRLQRFLGAHLLVGTPFTRGLPDTSFSRMLDAVDLLDMELGTVEGNRRASAADPASAESAAS